MALLLLCACMLRALPSNSCCLQSHCLAASLYATIYSHVPTSHLLILLPGLCWFLTWFTLEPWRQSQHVPLKHWLIFNWLCGTISKKVEPFITTAVRTTDPTSHYHLHKSLLNRSNLKMGAACSSKTLVSAYKTTQCDNPEDPKNTLSTRKTPKLI
jgi:hypothetical protein